MTRRAKVWDVLYPSVFMLIAVVVCTLAVSVIAAAVFGVSAGTGPDTEAVPLVVSGVFYIVTLLYQRRYFRMDEMRFGQDRKKLSARDAAPVIILCLAVSDLISTLLTETKIAEIFPKYGTLDVKAFQGQNIILLLAVTVILAPLAEELVFRGMTYRRIRAYLGMPAAVFLSAALFGIYHMNMIQFLFALVCGSLFALGYEISETLLLPVICHSAVNLYEIVGEYCFGSFYGAHSGLRAGVLAAEAAVGAVMLIIVLKRKRAAVKNNL